MSDKFNMTIEQNIFLAKRNVIDYIWKSANLEGIAVTFPDTQAIYNGIPVEGHSIDELVAVNNLKHAWQFVFDTIDYPLDLGYICELHRFVGSGLYYNAGHIRNYPVTMGGTDWIPDMPIESQIKEDIDKILEIENVTDRSISLMLYTMRKQMFGDGNKRTAMLVANKEMISSGKGVISVPLKEQLNFGRCLINYYETNNDQEVKKFVYEKCIDGTEFPKEQTLNFQQPIKREREEILKSIFNTKNIKAQYEGKKVKKKDREMER